MLTATATGGGVFLHPHEPLPFHFTATLLLLGRSLSGFAQIRTFIDADLAGRKHFQGADIFQPVDGGGQFSL